MGTTFKGVAHTTKGSSLHTTGPSIETDSLVEILEFFILNYPSYENVVIWVWVPPNDEYVPEHLKQANFKGQEF